MSRPRKKPTLIEMLNAMVAQATEEKRYGLVRKLVEVLEYAQPIPKEDENGSSSKV